MKATLLALLTIALGLVPAAYSQSMVEYSNLAVHAAKPLAAPLPVIHGKKVADPYGTTKGPMWQEKNARVKDQNPAPPAPPAVFILSSGERLESADYVMTKDTLRVVQNGTERTIPMSTLNVNATVAANRQRGVQLKIPDNKAQMTLSF
ncbi:MAG TPA: hypothetical protein VFB04_16220 [Terriglobales bacterium]|nr:hypothetical protein [Terriglobales bacterium]